MSDPVSMCTKHGEYSLHTGCLSCKADVAHAERFIRHPAEVNRTVAELSGPMGRLVTDDMDDIRAGCVAAALPDPLANPNATLDALALKADRARGDEANFGKGSKPQGRLPSEASRRKSIPVATGCLDYFPRSLAAIAELSRIGNDKHNPGQPLHWSRGKSNDHPDCLIRHFMERGTVDYSGAEPVLHSTQMAWRALAINELELEALASKKG